MSANAPAVDMSGAELVRGRIKNENKSQSFNKLWTVEEQKRYDIILI